MRLRTGDISVRDEIIGGHMRLCMSVVAKYSGRYPYIVDDLVGAAMIGLCQAVDWAPTRLYDNNISPYIYQTCERFVKDFIERRMVIHVPRKQFKNWQEESDAFLPVVSMKEHKEDVDNPADEFEHLDELSVKQVEDHPILFQELLESLQLTSRDASILDMLMAGYSQTEIATELDVSDMCITKIKCKIQEKLNFILRSIE